MFPQKIFKSLAILSILFTFTNCCTTKNELKEEEISMVKKNNIMAIAPGTAEVLCTVTNIYEKENKSFCSVKVNSVKKYGPATKPISANSEIHIELKDSFKEKIDSARLNNEEILITIASTPEAMGQENNVSWRIIKFDE
ncbi:MAG: hypothetical protein IPM32_05720 [Ignavibacteriae bacterium]|nr:hypothetical protein [Ignavibacteriota bacterium]